jgi:sigma-B regulation protein RsbU (phosphoserine phosphatase)
VRIPAAGGPPEFHGAEGFPVGFVPDVEYDQRSLMLLPGDRIYLYSDGVPEAMDKDREPYGEEKMAAYLDGSRGGEIEASVAGLLGEVETWCQPEGPLDDITILGVEWKP